MKQIFFRFFSPRFLLVFFTFLAAFLLRPIFTPHVRHRNPVCFSSNFTEHEKQVILPAMNIWHFGKFDVQFYEGSPLNCLHLQKTESQEEIDQIREEMDDPFVIGLTDTDNNTIWFISPNIENDRELALVAAHETGHWIYLDDVSPIRPAIMDGALRLDVINNSLHLYYDDILQLCNTWHCW